MLEIEFEFRGKQFRQSKIEFSMPRNENSISRIEFRLSSNEKSIPGNGNSMSVIGTSFIARPVRHRGRSFCLRR